MALDEKAVGKPFRKLRKLLKKFPDQPSGEDVHKLRTHARRVEAIAAAFQLDEKKTGRDLVKHLKPIRKSAGDVRDMDVLTDLAASVDAGKDGDCRLKLMQYLACGRTKLATKLLKKVTAHRQRVRAELRECAGLADAGLDAPASKKTRNEKSRAHGAHSMASSLELEQEIRAWPRLTAANIHPFRIKVKKLRYTLELGTDSDSRLLDALADAKDQIGLWHDWNELLKIGEDVLDHGARCPVIAEIRHRTKKELERALETANVLRERYLSGEGARSKQKNAEKKQPALQIHPAVLEAASRLAN